ncbi:DUF2871 family protein [Solibacillus isronensis]|uniref:DUF2871 family protein n=1 Tax=Solibacillus isronensis TaxID=412383 RepID=UPI0034DADD24
MTVLGKESSSMIAGIAGLGHIFLTIGMVLFFPALRHGMQHTKQPLESVSA